MWVREQGPGGGHPWRRIRCPGVSEPPPPGIAAPSPPRSDPPPAAGSRGTGEGGAAGGRALLGGDRGHPAAPSLHPDPGAGYLSPQPRTFPGAAWPSAWGDHGPAQPRSWVKRPRGTARGSAGQRRPTLGPTRTGRGQTPGLRLPPGAPPPPLGPRAPRALPRARVWKGRPGSSR